MNAPQPTPKKPDAIDKITIALLVVWDRLRHPLKPESFRPWRHPLLCAFLVIFVVGYAAMCVSNFRSTYGPTRATTPLGWCATTPGYIATRNFIDWTGRYNVEYWCPSHEDGANYPKQMAKWHDRPPRDGFTVYF